MALACYAKMARMNGDSAAFEKYLGLAKGMVPKWLEAAKGGRGGSYRLAFDQADSWSMKYNLVWDRALVFNLFPTEVAATEMAFYRTAQQKYGLPLDSRRLWTKADWLVWTATLTGKREDFDALVGPLGAFLNETPGRVPFSDWYETDSAKFESFRARSVVGGVYMPCLYNAALWHKYALRDTFKTGLYAPLSRKLEAGAVLVPEGRTSKDIVWRYTTEKPADGWQQPGFDDSAWKTGAAGFGSPGVPGGQVATVWSTPHLWVRRAFELKEGPSENLAFSIHHDEDAALYLNGAKAAQFEGYTTQYSVKPAADEAVRALKQGKNVLAAEVSQTTGGQYFDAGLVEMRGNAPFRLATYNIRCPGDKGDNAWEKRAERVRALIRVHAFDLVGLQEATERQINELQTEGWAHAGVGRDDGNLKGEAACIFYRKDRFDLRGSGTFWLSEKPETPGSKSWGAACTRICTWARLSDGKTGREFFWFNTHLDHISAEAREKGVALVLARIVKMAQGRPVFLTGDFNAPPDSAPVKLAHGVLRDSLTVSQTPHKGPDKTFNGFKYGEPPTERIDYVFVSAGIRVLSHATLDDSQGQLYPSDHFPVVVDASIE